MATGLIDIMKRASLDAVENGKPCDLRYGTVKTVNPLSVQITADFILPAEVLVVPETLTNHTMTVSLNWTTESAGVHDHTYSDVTEESNAHTHNYSGTVQESGGHTHTLASSASKTITLHNALAVGDKVALLRQNGGQSYYILDKI